MPVIAVKDEAEWLYFRGRHIGGSEIASLFYVWQLRDGSRRTLHMFEDVPEDAIFLGCLSPHKTGFRLWAEKAGHLMPDDLSDNERVQAGRFMEPSIAAWSEHKWNWKLRKTRRYLTHETVPGWGASLDYELIAERYPPVEMKTVDRFVFRSEWSADKESDEILDPPLNISLQLQAQIGVGASQTGWIVAVVGGNEIKRGEFQRHVPTQMRIAEAITAFWRSIDAGIAPERYADHRAIVDLYRDGTPNETPLDLTSDPALPELCRRYKRLVEHQKFIETVAGNVKGRILGRLGESTRARTRGYRVSWPAIHRPEKLIPARLQAALNYRGGLTVSEVDATKQIKGRK
jgi:predicted phage-related endonuclease